MIGGKTVLVLGGGIGGVVAASLMRRRLSRVREVPAGRDCYSTLAKSLTRNFGSIAGSEAGGVAARSAKSFAAKAGMGDTHAAHLPRL